MELENTLKDFLEFERQHPAVIIGVGSLGAALIQDSGLTRYGLNIVAGFDIDPDKIGAHMSDRIPVYHVEVMQKTVSRLGHVCQIPWQALKRGFRQKITYDGCLTRFSVVTHKSDLCQFGSVLYEYAKIGRIHEIIPLFYQ